MYLKAQNANAGDFKELTIESTLCLENELLKVNKPTIPAKLIIRRLFLPCLSIREDATAVPARIS